MLGRVKSPHAPLMACDLTSARLASHPHGSNDFVCLGDIEKIKTHLGGDSVLDRIGARDFIADHDDVSFRLEHPNPKGVHSVVLSLQPRGFFNMDCYGAIQPGALSAPLLATAKQILPENLATVLGQLTGNETLHHRHY